VLSLTLTRTNGKTGILILPVERLCDYVKELMACSQYVQRNQHSSVLDVHWRSLKPVGGSRALCNTFVLVEKTI
jgi:hypothetical protein